MKSGKRTVYGGVEVEVEQLPALDLLAEWSEVAVRVMPILSAIDDAKERKADLVTVIPMFAALGRDGDQIAQRLLRTASAKFDDVGGERALLDLNTRENINTVFRGNLLGLYGAIFLATEVHYGDFLGGAGAGSPGRGESKATAAEPSD